MDCMHCSLPLDTSKSKSNSTHYSAECNLKGSSWRVLDGLRELDVQVLSSAKTRKKQLCLKCYKLLGKIFQMREQLQKLETQFHSRVTMVTEHNSLDRSKKKGSKNKIPKDANTDSRDSVVQGSPEGVTQNCEAETRREREPSLEQQGVMGLPDILEIRPSEAHTTGLAVWTKTSLPPGFCFTSDSQVQYKDQGQPPETDGCESSWMSFLSFALTEDHQNLLPFHFKGQKCYRTTKPIPASTELLLWCQENTADAPVLSIDAPVPSADADAPVLSTDAPVLPTDAPAPSTDADTPAPSTDADAPVLSTDADTPVPYTDAPALSTDADAPVPSTDTPMPSTDTDTLALSTDADTLALSTDAVIQPGYCLPKSEPLDMIDDSSPDMIDDSSPDTLAAFEIFPSDMNGIDSLASSSTWDHSSESAVTPTSEMPQNTQDNLAESPFSESSAMGSDGAKFSANILCQIKNSVDEHITSIKVPPAKKQCTVCGKSYYRLNKHMKIHVKRETHACSTCGKIFKRMTYLEKHQLCHTMPFEKKPHLCSICGKVYSAANTLKSHMRLHTGERPYQCSLCEKSFIDSSKLSKHRQWHNRERCYKCHLCEKAFFQACVRDKHIIQVHAVEKPFLCSTCGKGYANSCLLKLHNRNHTGEKPYECDICFKRFVIRSKLNSHIKTHIGDKSFQCSFCDKKFLRSGCLNIHTRIHTGEKPYNCSTCGQGFSASGSLVRHTRIHTGEKPYQCGICSKSFTDSGKLTRHMRSHTGEKPYKCSICGQGFSESRTRNRHLKIHK